MTLTEFLLARIAEDEERAGSARMWFPADAHDGMDETPWMDAAWWESVGLDARHSEFCARHDPARVLAECEAKRRIVEIHGDQIGHDGQPCWSPEIRLLASVHADHPDYRAEWKP